MWLLTGQVEEGAPVRDVPIIATPFQIGRRTGLSFCIPSRTVSNLHAEFVERDGMLVLRDLGSTNGTYVNGERILVEKRVHEGDLVQFSNVVFRLKRQNEVSGVETLQGENCDQAMALIQFDRLMSERAIVAFYQPIVRSGDFAVVAYEVLGRSSLYGLKTPDLMFQAAAQLNLESELSRICRRIGLETYPIAAATPSLFVNTHPTELQDIDTLVRSMEDVRKVVPSLKITLEIHEAAVTNADTMRHLRSALKDLAIGMAYDDFGAGQARLIELTEVPPDVLKFDIALTRDVHRAPFKRKQMLKSLIRMVRDMGIQALAEGMETAAEAHACLELGFDLHQGFYYGEPCSGPDLASK
jgi:EAL domain-containing protein (putative c-di-GMP-specific phosphodiesterase class I)